MTAGWRRLPHNVLKAVLFSGTGALVVLLTTAVLYLDSRADLSIWHRADLDEEFSAESDITDFDQYLALEERLFRQLDQQVYARLPAEQHTRINRFNPDSLSSPLRWPRNWNRSFELTTDSPVASVLLLHGMSDSPYSLHQVGTDLNKAGAHVLGLRLPGHGTAPSGLVGLTWQDLSAAVELAMLHLAKQGGERPLYIVGYSTGAALALNYTIAALDDPTLPHPDRLVMLSPAIGVSPLAVLAVWQARLGRLLGLDKLAWNSIQPEYDPFKYGSFAINAGDVVYQLTLEIQRKMATLQKSGKLTGLPPILAFASVVDATVSTPALVNGLFDRLPAGGHELVLFDINRSADIEQIRRPNSDSVLQLLQGDETRHYGLSILSNEPDKAGVTVSRTVRGTTPTTLTPLDQSWPEDLYSLSHVALPFSPLDPLYGGSGRANSPGIRLGGFSLMGETGVLQIPAAEMLRLRWNPFYAYLLARTLEFLSLPPHA